LSCLCQVGTVTWIEIPATDLTRVQAFYSSVFGWNYPASSAPTDPNCAAEPQYVIFNKGITNGGFCKVSPENFLSPALHPDNPEKVRTSVRVTLNVESVDETLIAIEKAGGSVYV
jgi:predicted enzyme related to lactoylglutathione lyase